MGFFEWLGKALWGGDKHLEEFKKKNKGKMYKAKAWEMDTVRYNKDGSRDKRFKIK